MSQATGLAQERRRDSDLLFVDLDGSLVTTDLLWEHLFALLRRRPWLVIVLPLWLLKGRSGLKAEVARRAEAEAASLPYNAELLDLLRARRAAGARLVLATATPRPWAEAVAQHLGLFDAVLATEPGRNLKGAGKLAAIRAYCRDCGAGHFGYVGDSEADLVIWRKAAWAYIVAPTNGLARRLGAMSPAVAARTIGAPRRPLRAALRAVRPHRWARNALTFVPVLIAHRLDDPAAMLAATLAAIAFSLVASATYLINDLVDLPADRAHAEKRRRPFASGELPLAWGPPMAIAS